jgi:hypothetical protein
MILPEELHLVREERQSHANPLPFDKKFIAADAVIDAGEPCVLAKFVKDFGALWI